MCTRFFILNLPCEHRTRLPEPNIASPDITPSLPSPARRPRRAATHTSRRYPRRRKRGLRPPLKPSRWRGACPRGRRRLRCRPSTSSASARSLPLPPPAPAPRLLPRSPTPSAASPRSWVTPSYPLLISTRSPSYPCAVACGRAAIR